MDQPAGTAPENFPEEFPGRSSRTAGCAAKFTAVKESYGERPASTQLAFGCAPLQ